MATSLKNPPATELTSNSTKKYLDFAGLNALWDNICDKFAPQWKSVNFDFIANTEPTHEASTVVIPFQNLSMPPTAQGVVDHTHVNQTTYTIQAATQTTAGVMSSADKQKLDNIEGTAESAVTLKGVMVGGKTLHLPNDATNADQITDWKDCLTIDSNKHVAWTLEYNDVKDELQIIDLNAAEANKVKSAVKVSDMLGGVLENALIDSVELTSVNDNNESGTFIAITFKTDARDIVDENGTVTESGVSTTTIYCNVADLIETYTEGDGISINQSATSIDGSATATTISVIAPKHVSNDNKIGGIKSNNIYSESTVTNWKNTETKGDTAAPAIQNLSNASGRYFGVETDKDGHAFVNVPVATLSVGTDSTSDTETISNNTSDAKFTVVSGLSTTLSDDGQTWTLVPELKEITLSREEEITVTENKGEDKGEVLANGCTITYIDSVNVTENTHELNYTPKTVTLVETPIALTEKNVDNDPDNAPDITVALTPGVTTPVSIPVITNIEATGTLNHTIVETTQKMNITVADPAAIDIDYIEGLVWSIPITKQYYPNESTKTE